MKLADSFTSRKSRANKHQRLSLRNIGSTQMPAADDSTLRTRRAGPSQRRKASVLEWRRQQMDSSSSASMSATASSPSIEIDNESFGVDNLQNGLERVRWRDLSVGSLVVVFGNQIVPADCVLIASSDSRGTAFIETSSLDGETNLKVKHSHPDCQRCILNDTQEVTVEAAHEQMLLNTALLRMGARCSPPTADLRTFQGSLIIEQGNIPLSTWKNVNNKGTDIIELPLDQNQVCHCMGLR